MKAFIQDGATGGMLRLRSGQRPGRGWSDADLALWEVLGTLITQMVETFLSLEHEVQNLPKYATSRRQV